ncbi:MAG: pyridoxal-phosphate dependent enzyme [Steroidobacteraceae bacterium]
MALQAQPDVLSLIGNTPLVAASGFDTGPCELFLKLENQNPSGSIKDRVGLFMIEAAEREGRLKPGATLIEATAGNTGLGLALVAARKGYRLLLVIPDKMSQEKIFHLKAMGAEVVMTRSDVVKGHPDYYQDKAARIARETPDAFYINQFTNPANLKRMRRPRRRRSGTDAASAGCHRLWRRNRWHTDGDVAVLRAHGTPRCRSYWPTRRAPCSPTT